MVWVGMCHEHALLYPIAESSTSVVGTPDFSKALQVLKLCQQWRDPGGVSSLCARWLLMACVVGEGARLPRIVWPPLCHNHAKVLRLGSSQQELNHSAAVTMHQHNLFSPPRRKGKAAGQPRASR